MRLISLFCPCFYGESEIGFFTVRFSSTVRHVLKKRYQFDQRKAPHRVRSKRRSPSDGQGCLAHLVQYQAVGRNEVGQEGYGGIRVGIREPRTKR